MSKSGLLDKFGLLNKGGLLNHSLRNHVLQNQSNKKFGMDFETRVLCAFERNGYSSIRKNQWKRNFDLASDPAGKREYDLVFYRPALHAVYIVECKAHFKPDSLTGLEEVVEFSSKLKNYNGRHAVPVMVTNTGYTSPAINLARESSIFLLDGGALERMERQGSVMNQAKSRAYSFAILNAENLISRAFFS